MGAREVSEFVRLSRMAAADRSLERRLAILWGGAFALLALTSVAARPVFGETLLTPGPALVVATSFGLAIAAMAGAMVSREAAPVQRSSDPKGGGRLPSAVGALVATLFLVIVSFMMSITQGSLGVFLLATIGFISLRAFSPLASWAPFAVLLASALPIYQVAYRSAILAGFGVFAHAVVFAVARRANHAPDAH